MSAPRGDRRRARPGSPLGRAARGLLGCILIAVLLVFGASITGLLRPRGAPEPSAEGAVAAPRGMPALLAEMEAGRRQPHGVLSPERARTRPDEQIRVFVSNGCGVPRLGARIRDMMRGPGFDVCGVSTADAGDYAETVVIDRCGERWKAETVRDYLQERFGVGRLVLQVRNSPETDVLVILGADLAARLEAPAPDP